MASTYSPNLRLELITTGEQSGTWGATTNTNLGTLLEQAIGGYESVGIVTGDNTLTTQNGSTDQSRNAVLRLSGSLSGTTTVNCGLIEKVYIVQNDATGSVTFRANSSDTGISLASGARKLLYCNGTNVLEAVNDLPSGATVGGLTLVSISGTQTLTNKTLTAPVIATISNTGTLTLPTSTDTLVGRATTDTLTNKTLTAPKFADGGFLADSNGNEMIVLDSVASAVNELTVANAATGAGPSISATGSDTNIDLNLVPKGTGAVNVSGRQIISVTDNTNAALRITQLGTGEAIRVEDSTNPDSTPFIVNASGNVGVGTASPDALLSVSGVASFGAGSAAAPSIAGFGDLNTGVFFPAADTVAVAANGSEKFRFGSGGQLGIGGATYGTSGQVLTSGGASAAPTWSDKLSRDTSIATTSGTSHGFTTIPTGTKKITVVLDGVSVSGTSRVLLQLGTGGSYVTTGYQSSSANVYGSDRTAVITSTTGFVHEGVSASTLRSGTFTLFNITGNIWVSTHVFGDSAVTTSPGNVIGGGRIALSGALDRLRITTVNGTDTFDAGNVNVFYE